jgi:hypothetical protein
MSKIKEHYHEEITRGLNLPSDEEWSYEAYKQKWPHIAAFAERTPESFGFEAYEKGVTSADRDGRFLAWVAAAERCIDEPLTVGWWISKTVAWMEGWRRAESEDLARAELVTAAQIAEWEERRANNEHPEWLISSN